MGFLHPMLQLFRVFGTYTYLLALFLEGPPWDNLEIDLLAVLHLDN